jgi:hypothetical protein
MITQDQVKELFNYDKRTGDLTWKAPLNCSIKIGAAAGYVDANGYLISQIAGKKYKNHRIIFLYCHGYLPPILDHIDADKLNNRIDNLRVCTLSENSHNANIRKDNKSGIKGVSFSRSSKKWLAQIQVNGKKIYIGLFDSIKCAEKAVRERRSLIHKGFANHG